MLMDKNLLLADGLAITAANTYETDSIDLEKANPRQIGDGEAVRVLIQATEAFAGGTSAQFQLVEATNDALTAGVTVLRETPAILTADLTLGAKFTLFVPPAQLTKRYLGVRIISVGTFTTGEIDAGIVWDEQQADAGWPGVPAETGF